MVRPSGGLGQAFAVSLAYQAVLAAAIIGGAFASKGDSALAPYLVRILETWDAEHYLRIATEGYSNDPAHQSSIVFFPFYPLLISLLTPAAGALKAAVTVTTIASVLGHALLFHYLKSLGYDRTGTLRVAALVFLTPISIYFTAVYSEATYFLLTVAFLIFLRREQFFPAALCGLCAALTRNMGLLFVIPYLCAIPRSGPLALALQRAAYALLIPCGTAAYLIINAVVLGDPFAFVGQLSETWDKQSVNPLGQYWWSLEVALAGHPYAAPGYELLHLDRLGTLLFPLLLAAYGWRTRLASPGVVRMPPGFVLWAVAQYLVICSQSIWVSNLRYLCLIVPAYLMLERVLAGRVGYAIYLAVSAVIAVWAGHQYVRLSWVF